MRSRRCPPSRKFSLPASAHHYGTAYGINDIKNLQDFVLPGIKTVVEQKKLPLIDLHTALSGEAGIVSLTRSIPTPPALRCWQKLSPRPAIRN